MPKTPPITGGPAAWFGVPEAPSLGTALLTAQDFSVTHILRPMRTEGDDRIVLPVRDAYIVTLYLRDIRHSDLLPDGSATLARLYREGCICLVDLAQGAAIRLYGDLDCLVFFLPRDLLADIARLPQAPRAIELRCRRGEEDDTVRHLGAAVRALIHVSPNAAVEPLRHIGIALGAHLLHHYAARPGNDALSIWAETDAKSFMIAHHARPIRMGDVAERANMAPRPFARGFQQATGISPARWLARYRVQRAKECMIDDDLPLAEVAYICGFRGEGQMTSIFRRETGSSPEEWLGRTGS